MVTVRACNMYGRSEPAQIRVFLASTPAAVTGLNVTVHTSGGVLIRWDDDKMSSTESSHGTSNSSVLAFRLYIDHGWGIQPYRTQISQDRACDSSGASATFA